MKLLYVLAVAVGVVAAATNSTAATKTITPIRNKDTGKCTSDAECTKYPGTVCITINLGGFSQGKCTPNYGTRPVCRGGQAGLCPSYQTTTVGYINAQCVLVDKTSAPATDTDAIVPETPKATNKTAAARFLFSAAANETAAGTTPDLKVQPCPTNKAILLSDPECWFNTPHGDETLTVQYRCISYDLCLEQSAWSKGTPAEKDAYCHPKGCVTGDRQLCNDQGTCQGNDPYTPMSPKGYSCRCYAGYTGRMCEKQSGSKECDVDCGLGGACIDGNCVCYEGWQSLDPRCSKCTRNSACENDNKCNVESGKCQCGPGFNGPTCGGKLLTCAGVKCLHGGFLKSDGLTCGCVCPVCPAGTSCIPCGGLKGTDCSTCPGYTGSTTGSGSAAGKGKGGASSPAPLLPALSAIVFAVSTFVAMAM